VIGIYLYDTTLLQKIRCLKPSGRDELEITDRDGAYIEERKVVFEMLEGCRTAAGRFVSLLSRDNLVADTGADKMPDALNSSSQNAAR
jgi:glucose-1-phosphate thymidylyltransferase